MRKHTYWILILTLVALGIFNVPKSVWTQVGSAVAIRDNTTLNRYAIVTAAGALTVDNSVAMAGYALDATLAKLTLAQASATTGQTGPLVMGAAATSAPTYTNGKTYPLSLTTTGGLRSYVENLVVDPAEGAAASVAGSLIAGHATTTQKAAVDDGDATRIASTVDGRIINLPYAPAGQAVEGRTAAITDQTSTSVVAAVASNYLYITTLFVQNAHATVGTWVEFEDGTGGAKVGPPIWAGPLGGGGTVKLDPPIRLTSATALYVVAATTGTSYRAYARGFKSTN